MIRGFYIFLFIFTLIICIASTNQFIVPELTERQDRTCLVRSCNQLVTGRRLRYGRALAIVNNEEYLDAVSLSSTTLNSI